jgi:multidrug resistance efflux pump
MKALALLLISCIRIATAETPFKSTAAYPAAYPCRSVAAVGLQGQKQGLYFNCNGVLAHIYVHKGGRFKKGQLLASLEYKDVNAPLRYACFYRDKAREAYVQARAQFKNKAITAAQLEAAKKGLNEAEANLQKSLTAEGNYFLVAPSNGIVLEEAAKPGDLVFAGKTIMTVSVPGGRHHPPRR